MAETPSIQSSRSTVAARDEEAAGLFTPEQQRGVRSLLAASNAVRPSNFHLAATASALSASSAQPTRRLLLLLSASVFIVLLQVACLSSVTSGVELNSCQCNSDCLYGFYCAAVGLQRCMACASPGYCQGGSSAINWALIQNLDLLGRPFDAADYAAHCAACYDAETLTYTTSTEATRTRLQSVRAADRVALVFTSLFVALALANELRDVQICALMRRRAGSKAPCFCCSNRHVVLWLVEAVRRFTVLPFITTCVLQLTVWRGADALSVCLNAVAMLFVLEVDDQIYAHGVSDELREWCEASARPVLTEEEERAVAWSRAAGIPFVWLGLPVIIIFYPDLGSVAPIPLLLLTVLPPMLAEAASLTVTRRGAARMLELLLQFAVGFGCIVLVSVVDGSTVSSNTAR